ncbi:MULTISPECIES: hypothetical protein [unclassified Leptolyngbya]|uniref:hypothetical protein n=1 Tax=unclassified Leptolyngbya TaxID=2650499 RepID=UPI001686A1A2|nr:MULTISPECIES: hypothetical protein [unclassified Leptolyngbya]MBD1909240.1 hypothetical protein [Leptolyngbya sp. FACHB-8]MBD2156596.1 hypothetical protein [Leptolyngbya sp. FACHB-16]
MNSDDDPSFRAVYPSKRLFYGVALIKLAILPIVAIARMLLHPTTSPVITLDEYNRIQPEMTISQVQAIVQHPGVELEKRHPKGPGMANLQIYQWRNDSGSHALVWFQNGEVAGKVKVNLKE